MISGAIISGAKIRGIGAVSPVLVQQNRQTNTGTSITFVYTTPPRQGNLMLILMGCVQSRTITPPPGFTQLFTTAFAPVIVAYYKIAGPSESNSYAFSYVSGGSGNNWAHGMEFSGIGLLPAQLVGFNNSNGFAANSNVNIPSKRVLVAGWSLTGTVSSTSVDNEFGNKLPASGSSYSCSAMRTYEVAENNQNVRLTPNQGRSVLIRVNPKFED